MFARGARNLGAQSIPQWMHAKGFENISDLNL
jgi:hypothetical protein